MMRKLFLAALLVAIPASSTLAVTQTVSFQNGANGYTGTFDRRISSGNWPWIRMTLKA
jgi:hypothetical protein